MYRAIRDSMAMCRGEEWDVALWVTGYTVGHCEEGEPQAKHRVELALRWWARAPWLPPID
jgi:hypothetical protein